MLQSLFLCISNLIAMTVKVFPMRRLQLGLVLILLATFVGCGKKGDPTHCKIGIANFKIPDGWIPTEGEGNVVVNLTREDDTGRNVDFHGFS